MKTKKVLPLISLLFVAIMLFSVGMIVKEHRERQQDIKGFEKLADIITEVEQTDMTDNVEPTDIPQEQKQSSRNLTLTIFTILGTIWESIMATRL